MHTFDGHSLRLTFSLLLLLSAGLISACDDKTVVGGNLSPDDVVVNADTIVINDINVVKSPAFSGNRTFFTTGVFEDPLFGKLSATALIRPSIAFVSETDTIGSDQVSYLSLNIDNIYGSDSEPVDFEIVEIGRRWRSTSWRYDSIPDLTSNVVGQFTVTGPDSVTVRLNDDWTSRYIEIFQMSAGSQRDSLYRTELPGLAIVPVEGAAGKMFSVEAARARLLIEQNGELPDLVKGMSNWAVSFSAEGFDETAAGTSKLIYNTMGSMLELDLELTEEFLGTNNFSRVELVMYEDTIRMAAGIGPDAQFVRPRPQTMRMFYLDADQINYSITSEPRFQVNRRTSDNSYRVNLTGFTQERLINLSDPRKLYILVGSNDGRIIPMLLSGPDDPNRQPKILITSISQE
jgi:hypothetical protein